jgi:hypothetical protein
LASLPEAAKFMREGITLQDLHELARALTDVQAAEELNEARNALFRRVLRARAEIQGAAGATAAQSPCSHHRCCLAPAVDNPAVHTTRAWTAPG